MDGSAPSDLDAARPGAPSGEPGRDVPPRSGPDAAQIRPDVPPRSGLDAARTRPDVPLRPGTDATGADARGAPRPGPGPEEPPPGGWPRIRDYWPDTAATGTVGGPGTLGGETATGGGAWFAGAPAPVEVAEPAGMPAMAGLDPPRSTPSEGWPAAGAGHRVLATDADGRAGSGGAAHGGGPAPTGAPAPVGHPPAADAGAGSPAYPVSVPHPAPGPSRHRLRVLVALVGAAVFLGVSVLVLTRVVTRPEPVAGGGTVPAPAGDGGIVVSSPSPPVSIAPAPAPAPTSPATSSPAASAAPAGPPAGSRPRPAFAAATFVLTSDITELNVAVGRPPRNGIARVFSPDDSGVLPRANLDGTTIRLSAERTGERGSARVDVLLDERIAWTIEITGGVRRGVFAMAGGQVRGFDLTGGADRLVMTLPRQARAIPIRMAGGVHTWRIRTAGRFPVEVRLRRGAGEVELNGDRDRGVGRGETLRARGADASGGLEVDAVAGVGSLTVEPLDH